MNTEELCAVVQTMTRKELVKMSAATDVSYSTLEAIKRQRTRDPRGKTLDRLKEYLKQNPPPQTSSSSP